VCGREGGLESSTSHEYLYEFGNFLPFGSGFTQSVHKWYK